MEKQFKMLLSLTCLCGVNVGHQDLSRGELGQLGSYMGTVDRGAGLIPDIIQDI